MLNAKRQVQLLSVIMLVWLVVGVTSGCSENKLTPIPLEGTILAFGDSLTAGVGTTKDKSYPSVLAELTGRHIINAGISGEETKAGLQRFEHVLVQSKPDLVILLEGGNDILRNRKLSNTKKNLAAMFG